MTRPILAFMAVVLAAGLWLGASSSRFRSWWSDLTPPKIPTAEPASTNTTPPFSTPPDVNRPHDATVRIPVTEVPREKNLAVPFTSQAPNANWDADHEEFCEEAAMLMVGRFFQGRDFTGAVDQENGLQQIKKWEVENLGFYFDTTAEENAKVLAGLYGLQVELMKNPTIKQIKTALAAGQPMIVPAAGRELKNPNFKRPGPIYHNLVIRGYTKDGKFITNDPGTRKGREYLYDQDVIMSAMHDWVPRGDRTIAGSGGVADGAKAVLIVSRSSNP